MKTLLLKLWNFLKQKNNMLIAVLILLFLAMGTTIYFQNKSINKYKDKYQTEVKLKNALLDTMGVYQNKEKEWVAEKLTIQESIKNLEKINAQLTNSQKELLARVKEMNKNYDVIAAALIETNVLIKGLTFHGEPKVDTINKTINFTDSSNVDKKVVYYDITATKVIPAFPNIKTGLVINRMYFPNKQFVAFRWEKNKGANYPVSFSVSNSNDYFRTVNIESYAIPELKYEGTKFEQWLAKNGKVLMYLGIGAGSATAVWLLAK
jgi:cell division protein FtsB